MYVYLCTYNVKCGYVRKTSLVILFDICPIFFPFILLPSIDLAQNVKETKMLCPNVDDDDDVDDHF